MQLFFFVAIILWPGIIYGQDFGPEYIKDLEQKYCSEKRNDPETHEQCMKNAFYSLQPIYKSHEKNMKANAKQLRECLGLGEESDEESDEEPDGQLLVKCIKETGFYTNKELKELEASLHQPNIIDQAIQNPTVAFQLSKYMSEQLRTLGFGEFPRDPCYDKAEDTEALNRCLIAGGPSPDFIVRFNELHNIEDNQAMKACFEEPANPIINAKEPMKENKDPMKIMSCLSEAAKK